MGVNEAELRVLARSEAALQRLEASVSRLQAVVERDDGRDAGLAAELSAARSDLAAMQRVTREASGRLDAAILRLKTVVEG